MFVGIFHGRFASFGVIELVIVVVYKKLCFELLSPGKWVYNTMNDTHQEL
jgi:hypothetical protein